MSKLKLTGDDKKFKKTASKINPKELLLAMSEATKCGCGLNCEKGYLVLPNHTADCDVVEYYAVYVIDGVLTAKPIEDAEAEINALCCI